MTAVDDTQVLSSGDDWRSSSEESLRVEGLTVRFGGLVAVRDVSLEAPVGQLTGLIGPNGAGKSTTFNACSGLLRPSNGDVHLLGRRVNGMSPQRRAQLGLGRTFQRMELFDRLSVADNVLVGAEARDAGRKLGRTIWQSRAIRGDFRYRRDLAIELCGLHELAARPAGALSTGQRRLVELARAIAGDFRLLLLDEPSSGLDHTESENFGRILRHVVDTLGTGILLVEHDIALVRNVCDYIYVLDFGALIAQGPAADVLASDIVKAAYLGEGGDA
jgi:ABC-type branched-subunit amino acid transport system ATPase component